jgi:hypothetical protein
MPDLWDTNPDPDNVFNTPDEQPNPTPNDQPKQVRLRDDRGRLRPPAYVLIALAIAVVAVLVVLAGLLFASQLAPTMGSGSPLPREATETYGA